MKGSSARNGEWFRGEARRFTRYGVIGLLNNLGLYVLFVFLIYIDLPAVISAGMCYILGVAISYGLNRYWTFDSRNSHMRDLPRFLIAYGIGLICTMVTISFLIRLMSPELAQLFNIVITAVVIYVSLRLLRFGSAGG